MPLRTLALALVLSGCGCGSEPGADAPPRTDTPVDDTLNGVLTVESEGCEDWVPVPHPSPELDPPLGATAERVWTWDPRADPLLREEVTRGTIQIEVGMDQTDSFALAPDGALWAKGPSPRILMRLSREGQLTWIRQFEYGPHGGFSSSVRLAPDGSAYMLRQFPSSMGPDPVLTPALVRVMPEGVRDGVTELVIGEPGEAFLGEITIGPGGRVYVARGTEVIATCQGRRVLWRLRVRFGEEPAFVPRVLATESGRLLGSIEQGSRPVTISEEGELAWLPGGEGDHLDSGLTGAGPGGIAGEMVMWTATTDGASIDLVLSQPAGDVWSGEAGPSEFGAPRLAPSGDVWLSLRRTSGPVFRVMNRGEVRWERPVSCAASGLLFDADSNQLCFGPTSMLRIHALDGEVEAIDGIVAGAAMNDIDGRLYRAFSEAEPGGIVGGIIALRTSIRPPRGAYCMMDGCNRHRNNWAHDYGTP